MTERTRTNNNQLSDFLKTVGKEPYVVMGIGLPGSGKSVALKEIAKSLDATYVSRGDLRFTQKTVANTLRPARMLSITQIMNREITRQLRTGGPVVIDAGHLDTIEALEQRRRNSRPELISRYRGFGAKGVMAAVFHTSLEELIATNGQRAVPIDVERLGGLYEDLEYSAPVTTAEGFDLIAERAAGSDDMVITAVA